MSAIKYQDRIHTAFANEVILKEPLEEFKRMQEQFPNLKFKADPIDNKEADALKAGNIRICQFFTAGYDVQFENERVKDVEQTVRANVNYYNNVCNFLTFETDKEYVKIYTKIQAQLEDYFSLAAENVLEDVYGEAYTTFRDRFTAEEEAKQAERVATRKQNKAKKLKEEQESAE